MIETGTVRMGMLVCVVIGRIIGLQAARRKKMTSSGMGDDLCIGSLSIVLNAFFATEQNIEVPELFRAEKRRLILTQIEP